MFKNLCIAAALLLASAMQAQVYPVTKEKVGYLAGFYYQQSNWNELIKLKYNIIALDDPELIGKLGVAEFYKKQYASSERHLKKYLKKYPDSPLERELLFYSILFQSQELEARRELYKSDASLQEKLLKNNPQKLFKEVTLETGIRDLKQTEIGNPIQYISGGITLEIGKSVNAKFVINYLSQKIYSGKYTQPEVYFSLPVALGDGWKITPAIHGLINDYKTDNELFTLKNKLFFTQLNIQKRYGSFTIKPSFGVHFSNDEVGGAGAASLKMDENIIQTGLTLGYTAKLSSDLYYNITPSYYFLKSSKSTSNGNNDNAFSINNSFYFKDWSFFASFLQKNGINPFAENEGEYYFNLKNEIKSRFSFSLGYDVSRQLNLMGTFQLEDQRNIIFSQTLNYQSYYLTLKYKF